MSSDPEHDFIREIMNEIRSEIKEIKKRNDEISAFIIKTENRLETGTYRMDDHEKRLAHIESQWDDTIVRNHEMLKYYSDFFYDFQLLQKEWREKKDDQKRLKKVAIDNMVGSVVKWVFQGMVVLIAMSGVGALIIAFVKKFLP